MKYEYECNNIMATRHLAVVSARTHTHMQTQRKEVGLQEYHILSLTCLEGQD